MKKFGMKILIDRPVEMLLIFMFSMLYYTFQITSSQPWISMMLQWGEVLQENLSFNEKTKHLVFTGIFGGGGGFFAEFWDKSIKNVE